MKDSTCCIMQSLRGMPPAAFIGSELQPVLFGLCMRQVSTQPKPDCFKIMVQVLPTGEASHRVTQPHGQLINLVC